MRHGGGSGNPLGFAVAKVCFFGIDTRCRFPDRAETEQTAAGVGTQPTRTILPVAMLFASAWQSFRASRAS